MAKKITILFLLLGIGCVLTASAQEPLKKIETDRPDQTESPTIVPKGWLQLEAGLERRKIGSEFLYTLPTTLLKYGLLKKLELRFIAGYTSMYQSRRFTDTFGLLPLRLGFKYNLLQEKGILPQTSVIAHAGFDRLASKYFKSYSFLAPEARFTMQHSLTDKLGLGYNLGAEWESADQKPEWIYTLAPGYQWSERWYSYIELFGSVRKGERPEHNFDGGVAYHLSDNMRADVSAGVGLSSYSFDHYIAVGFSFRVPVSKRAVH